MVVAVTGATGHLGNNLVRALVNKGETVRCLVLAGENLVSLKGLDVELIEGDVRDPNSLRRAFSGAEVVYHLASIITLLPGQTKLLEQINVRGARNVAEECLKSGVRRLVYTSSIHAFVEPPHGIIIDESMSCDPARVHMEYSKSKAKGTMQVMDVMKQGLDAVMVMPTGIIGPHDYRPSETGQLILNFTRRRLTAYVDGGYDFVDVRDVAEGHILACQHGRTGEKYILSGEWISIRDLLHELASVASVPIPKYKVPMALANTIASILTGYGRLTNTVPLLNNDSLYTLKSNSLVSSKKAIQELGYRPRPIRSSICETLEWFREAGMVS